MSKGSNFLILISILFVNCHKCFDESCSICSEEDSTYCYKCKNSFIKHYSRCGKKCQSIYNCILCNAKETDCIKCKSNCVFTGKYCDCTERYILALVLFLFSLLMIGIIIFSLIHSSRRRRINIFNIFSGHSIPSIINNTTVSRHPLPEEITIENRIKELEMIKDFNKNKIEVDKNIETKLCFICKKNICNLKMGCGCFICFECEKKCVKANICLNCKNNMTTMQQVSCSICLCNKNEISTFNCPCKVVICKECYLKWRKTNNFCPSCREPII